MYKRQGLQGIETTSGIDVASLIISYLEEKIKADEGDTVGIWVIENGELILDNVACSALSSVKINNIMHIRIGTVSYTHLDVYKRQILNSLL